MPPVFLTLPVNTQGIIGSIPADDLVNIRDAARNAGDSAIDVQLGSGRYNIRHLPRLDVFRVDTQGGEILAGSTQGFFAVLDNQQNLEFQLNDGMSLIDARTARLRQQSSLPTVTQRISGKIDSCIFVTEQAGFQISGEHLTCPVTLCIPEKGVFARTSLQSDVCCLYEVLALKELVSRRLPHPVSREAITEAHIVPKEQCHFDPERGAFIHSASQ
ncbi:T3SS effector NleG family protein [Citrobacter braakii]|uniref:T3SS effector NleG family protein n=1 Tax=Citrobacter braakii TaxID=57706 RepID=UPI00351CE1E6